MDICILGEYYPEYDLWKICSCIAEGEIRVSITGIEQMGVESILLSIT